MRVILDVIEGPRKGRSFTFDHHDTFIVGRSRSVHCSMPEDAALSRDHFLIEINPPRCEIRDLGSTNGTFVNDRRVERVRLSSGDRIAAGQSIFQIWVEGRVLPSQVSTASAEGKDSKGEDSCVRCAGCDVAAPVDLVVAADNESKEGEAVEWLCPTCRAEVAATPQPVPHYTTLRELGRGSMGVVYLGKH